MLGESCHANLITLLHHYYQGYVHVYMLQKWKHWKPYRLQNDIFDQGFLFNFINFQFFRKMLIHACKTYLIVDGL
jgi:hypothetical protein